MGRALGITDDQLVDLPRFQESAAFSELEKLVLHYAQAITTTPVEVPEDLFGQLRKHFDEGQMVELTAAIAWENYRARFDHALGIEAMGFSEGAACALPERTPHAVSQM